MYGADLEEAFSTAQTWQGGGRHFECIGSFFSRPINTDVLRPIDRDALVVSPADSVLQNAFFITPDKDGKIVAARIPQVYTTTNIYTLIVHALAADAAADVAAQLLLQLLQLLLMLLRVLRVSMCVCA